MTFDNNNDVLRIDNSRQSVICTFGDISETMVFTRTCHVSNKRAHLSLSYDINDIVKRYDLKLKQI